MTKKATIMLTLHALPNAGWTSSLMFLEGELMVYGLFQLMK
jgi:hypothetical protein